MGYLVHQIKPWRLVLKQYQLISKAINNTSDKTETKSFLAFKSTNFPNQVILFYEDSSQWAILDDKIELIIENKLLNKHFLLKKSVIVEGYERCFDNVILRTGNVILSSTFTIGFFMEVSFDQINFFNKVGFFRFVS